MKWTCEHGCNNQHSLPGTPSTHGHSHPCPFAEACTHTHLHVRISHMLTDTFSLTGTHKRRHAPIYPHPLV